MGLKDRARAAGFEMWRFKIWWEDAVGAIAASRLVPTSVRHALLKSIGWKIGEGSRIYHSCCSSTPTQINIGKNVHVGPFSFFDGAGKVTIEDDVRIGSHLHVLTRTHPITAGPIRQVVGPGYDIDKDVTIGRGSWIASGVTLLPGASVAEACVIASGALVTKPTVSNMLYKGAPAEVDRALATG